MRARVAIAAALTLAIAGCAGGPNGPRKLKPVANPSAVVATELAFARAAQEDGQWKAFRKYADKSAIMLLESGPVNARSWLAGKADPAQPVTWEPLAVWSSCDGSLAVSKFAFTDPTDGTSGEGYTVWKRDRPDRYRYLFDMSYQAAPSQAPEMIKAEVAECKAAPAAPASGAVGQSDDGSLAWSYSFENGVRSLRVWTSGKAGPKLAIDQSVPAGDRSNRTGN